MTILPGLTTTKADRVDAFIEDALRLGITRLALFPTCLDPGARKKLYSDLERLPGLSLPHVHLRADSDEAELAYLCERFGAEAFNIHPRASTHPFGPVPERFRRMIFVENVDIPPEEAELGDFAGICLDYAHWENAKLTDKAAYRGFETLAPKWPIGCCHVSAMRPGVPNSWSGEWDHHEFADPADLDYMRAYVDFLPPKWISLELENSLPDQIAAARRLGSILNLST